MSSAADITDVEFQFNDIGPLTSANLQLGDLTVIAGHNNTGKTYIAYSLYALLKYGHQMLQSAILDSRQSRASTFSRLILDRFVAIAGQPTFDALPQPDESEYLLRRMQFPVKSYREEYIEELRRTLLDELVELFNRRRLPTTFGSRQPVETGTLGASWKKVPRDALDNAFSDPHLHVVYENIGSESKANQFSIKSEVIVTHPPEIDLDFVDSFLKGLFVDALSRFLIPELAVEPFVLSAERFGISLFYRELDLNRSEVIRSLQRWNEVPDSDEAPYDSTPDLSESIPDLLDKATSRYALPIHDNINFTRRIPDLEQQVSELEDAALFHDIEQMMGGRFVSDRSGPLFVENDSETIPLHLASSSARGLSDLYFFVLHVARRDHLLIIDEPEGHLDTTNQILMARLLTRLVKTGVRVLITTHSDYIIKEINNLIMLDSEFAARDDFTEEFKYMEGDGIPPEAVKAYVAEDGSLTRCKVDRIGMDMPIFDTTIDELNSASNTLYDSLSED